MFTITLLKGKRVIDQTTVPAAELEQTLRIWTMNLGSNKNPYKVDVQPV